MRTDVKALASNIDNELLELLGLNAHLASLKSAIIAKAARRKDAVLTTEEIDEIARYQARQEKIMEKVRALESVYDIYNWNRAWIVPAGHVHKNYHCHTLFHDTTRFLCPEVSGMTEDEIVAKAGERACTICYPSAPSEYLARKSQLMTRDEAEEEAKRQERRAAKLAKEAAKMTVFLPGEGKNGMNETYSSVRGARNAALHSIGWYLFSNTFYGPDSSDPHYANFIALVEAIAKREEADFESVKGELIGKALAKFKREHKGVEPKM